MGERGQTIGWANGHWKCQRLGKGDRDKEMADTWVTEKRFEMAKTLMEERQERKWQKLGLAGEERK